MGISEYLEPEKHPVAEQSYDDVFVKGFQILNQILLIMCIKTVRAGVKHDDVER